MLFETNFQLRTHTQTAWVVGKVGAEIPREPARIEDMLFVKRGGLDVLAYRVQYQNGNIGYVFLDESAGFKIVSFKDLVTNSEFVSGL
jgi:hypothetical protein